MFRLYLIYVWFNRKKNKAKHCSIPVTLRLCSLLMPSQSTTYLHNNLHWQLHKFSCDSVQSNVTLKKKITTSWDDKSHLAATNHLLHANSSWSWGRRGFKRERGSPLFFFSQAAATGGSTPRTPARPTLWLKMKSGGEEKEVISSRSDRMDTSAGVSPSGTLRTRVLRLLAEEAWRGRGCWGAVWLRTSMRVKGDGIMELRSVPLCTTWRRSRGAHTGCTTSREVKTEAQLGWRLRLQRELNRRLIARISQI